MLIKATNLTKKYGTKLALNHATIKIDQGQLIAYLEPMVQVNQPLSTF